MRYYLRVLNSFVTEAESEIGAAAGLIHGLDVRQAPWVEERQVVPVEVSADCIHWTLYHLPVPEPRQADVPVEDWQARAEAAEARAAQAEADARLMLAAYYGADSASITRFGLGDGLLSEGDLRRLDALRDAMFYTSEADTAAAMLRVLTTASA